MRLFKVRKVVDEREEMEMMRIEHLMYWFVFWALLASIFIQILVLGAEFSQVAGEWMIFMLMAIGTVFADIKGGHFDYCSRPGWKTYLIYSAVAAAGVMGLTLWRGVRDGYYRNPGDAVLPLLITGIFTGVVTYAALAAAGTFVKHRRKKLEKEFEEE